LHSRERVFWIKGSGGMGKSVISAQCIARYSTGPERPAGDDVASSPHVAAYFLCKHDSAERNDPRRVIATLAFRLAAQSPVIAAEYQRRMADAAVRSEMEGAVVGSKGDMGDAFRVLLADPLAAAFAVHPPVRPLVILIDALDELDASSTRAQLLDLVGRKLPTLPDCVRVIVTSRPESDIVASLKSLEPRELSNSDERHRPGDTHTNMSKKSLNIVIHGDEAASQAVG